MKQSLFDEVGGLPTLQRVHKIFYDKIYFHPWLGKFFEGHNQTAIENRQTTFMAEKMGGNVEYKGKDLVSAHRAMYITDELFDLRTDLLRESLTEAGIQNDLSERWIKIDNAFRRKIVKESIESFYATTWQYEQRVILPKEWSNVDGD